MLQKSNSTITVDLSKLKENVALLNTFLGKETGMMAVVKANAYGHGAVNIAKTLSPMVNAFAVNEIEEGIELRASGIELPILIFGVPEKPFADEYKKYDLTATISAEEHFRILPAGASYHLNFDTGMGRLGFSPTNAEKVAQLVGHHKNLCCLGLYSHFATSDVPDSSLAYQQLRTFNQLRTYFPSSLEMHICNTGGTAFYDSSPFDMVRTGIGMYGYAPGVVKIEGLQPILTWSTRLVQVNRVEANKTVSYGAHWKAPSRGYIGVIPVGYADGLPRNLTGKLTVRIASKEYEVAGTIAMNFCMIYLKDDFYEPGTEVQLIHPGSNAEDWAERTGTISYEILTGLHPQIPRNYIS